MKIIFTLFFALFASQAMAIQILNNKRMSGKELRKFVSSLPSSPSGSVIRPKGPNTTVTPSRQGILKTEIFRMDVRDLGDGSYSVSYSSLCLGRVPVNVYDLQGVPAASWSDGPVFSCAGDLDGHPVMVNVTGDILLNEGHVFSDETSGGIKTAWGRIWITDAGQSKQALSGMVSARGLDTHSLISWMGTTNFTSCKPVEDGSGDIICTATSGVFYSAQTEYLD